MDKYWAYLGALLAIPSVTLGFSNFDLSQKIDMERAMLRGMLASPIPQLKLLHAEPIVGEYFLITATGTAAVTNAPAIKDVEVIRLACGAMFNFWKPEDKQ